jgi:leader peptidase (prepilin peptidase)/N-methyltransferase
MPYLFFFLFGLAAGSFFNVCIHRLPGGKSIVFPPSHCPQCGKRLAARDLVPLFSYLLLRGRCRYCGGGISLRYPVVELITGLVYVSLYSFFGWHLLLLKYLFLASVLIIVTFIDLEHYIIPNKVVLAAFAGGVLINLLARDLTPVSAGLGIVAAAGFLFLPAVISRGGMGGGDIKLAAVIGLFLGWPLGLVAVFLGCCAAGLVGVALLMAKKKGRKDPIPFGPFLALGAFVTVLWGQAVIQWYMSFFRL